MATRKVEWACVICDKGIDLTKVKDGALLSEIIFCDKCRRKMKALIEMYDYNMRHRGTL